MSCYSFDFPTHLHEVIRATSTPMASNASDRLVWISSSTGNFDARNAYSLACNDTPNLAFFGGNWIWRIDTLPKIQMFIWKCFYNSIPVKEVLNKRGIDLDTKCGCCGDGLETILHVLRVCKYARKLREEVGVANYTPNFFNLDLCGWLRVNSNCDRSWGTEKLPWKVLFSFAI